MIDNRFKDYFKELVKENKKIDEICRILEISESELNIIFDELRSVGDNYIFHKNNIIMKKRPDIKNRCYKVKCDKDHVRLLLLGDEHLINKKSRIDLTRKLYDEAERTNTDYALVCGDVVEGFSLKYPDFLSTIFIDTYEGQKIYVIENHPTFSGKTLMVSGNHDDWWFRHTNKEILKEVGKERNDILYLGANTAKIEIGNLKINLLHGDIIPSSGEKFNLFDYLSGLETKPHIVHYGHAHMYHYIKKDNIHCFRTPSLVNPTNYSLNLEHGGYFVDVYMDDYGKVKEIRKTRKEYK